MIMKINEPISVHILLYQFYEIKHQIRTRLLSSVADLLILLFLCTRRTSLLVTMYCPKCDFHTADVTDYRKHIRIERKKLDGDKSMNFTCKLCNSR